MKGKIIVIEGTDGSGKKTQSELLFKHFKEKNIPVVLQSFPNYESPSSSPVKMYLNGEFGEDPNCLDAYQASALFAVDRVCTFQKLKEHYENGGVIIFDRYVEANMVHQASKIENLEERDKFLNFEDNFEFNILKLPRPDEVFFLKLPPKVSLKLISGRGDLKCGGKSDIHENENHLEKSYNAGIYVAEKFGWQIIDCLDKNGNLKKIDEIFNEILKKINIF